MDIIARHTSKGINNHDFEFPESSQLNIHTWRHIRLLQNSGQTRWRQQVWHGVSRWHLNTWFQDKALKVLTTTWKASINKIQHSKVTGTSHQQWWLWAASETTLKYLPAWLDRKPQTLFWFCAPLSRNSAWDGIATSAWWNKQKITFLYVPQHTDEREHHAIGLSVQTDQPYVSVASLWK
jgi:hypothetical protein